MRWVALALGVAMVVAGGLWTAEALGWFSGGAKEGEQFWATTGPLLAGLGVALVWVTVRPPQR
jgi:hypothetical protein